MQMAYSRRTVVIDIRATERMRRLTGGDAGEKIGVDYGIYVCRWLRVHLSQRLDLNYGS